MDVANVSFPDPGRAGYLTTMTTRPTLRILLVEDEESEAYLVRTLIGSLPGTPATCDWVASADEGFEALAREEHDVCLLDYHLGTSETGTSLLRRVRGRAIHTPIILLTGKGSRDVDLEAMEAGASDYLQKGSIDPVLLERSLRYAVERNRALAALRESEERNRGMFDHLPLGLFRVSIDGEYQEANPALIRMLEEPDRAYLRDTLSRHFFVAADDRARFMAGLESAGEITGFESRVVSGRGRPLILRVSARVHRDPRGAAEYVEGVVEDLTGDPSSHRMAEDAASFQALARSVEFGLLRTDPEGQLHWINDTAVEMLGLSGTAVLGQGVWNVVHPAEQDRIARAFEELAAGTRDRCERDVRVLRTDGTEGALRLVMTAVTGRGGSLQSMLGVLTPIHAPAPARPD
jgi:PAS domain S-box-containing protein